MPYSEGYQVIHNDDGSTTYVTIEHAPHQEPMSKAATVLWTTGLTLVTGALIGAPVIATIVEDRLAKRKTMRDRQKKNMEIFHQLKTS